jgi:uncharacterized protein (TIGR03437 family)
MPTSAPMRPPAAPPTPSPATDGTASATQIPLPTVLGGVGVNVGGVDAPLFYVSPSQINFQVPFEIPLHGITSIVVTRNGNTSPPISGSLAEYAPGIFTYARREPQRRLGSEPTKAFITIGGDAVLSLVTKS